MPGDNSVNPGEIVETSSLHSVVHDDGKGAFEVTCVEGEHSHRREAVKVLTMN